MGGSVATAYFAVECTRARVDVCSGVAPAPNWL